MPVSTACTLRRPRQIFGTLIDHRCLAVPHVHVVLLANRRQINGLVRRESGHGRRRHQASSHRDAYVGFSGPLAHDAEVASIASAAGKLRFPTRLPVAPLIPRSSEGMSQLHPTLAQRARCNGSAIVKTHPVPGTSRTDSVPKSASTLCRAMAKPRPSPVLSALR